MNAHDESAPTRTRASTDGHTGRDETGLTGGYRPIANSLTVMGTALVVLGGWSILRNLGVIPDVLGRFVGDWWAVALVVGGAWMIRSGRRASGTMLALLGVVLLTFALLPAAFVGPVLLIGIGIALVIGAAGRRRWFAGGPAAILLGEIHGEGSRDGTRSIVAVFDGEHGTIDAHDRIVECLAVFDDVRVRVPRDVAIELRQTAVFGSTRAPQPPPGPVVATVRVRATALFGDVRIDRD